MSIVSQLLVQDPPNDLSRYCKSNKESCKFCRKLPMMPWISWCEAYNKKLNKGYYPERLSNCNFQVLIEDKFYKFYYMEI